MTQHELASIVFAFSVGARLGVDFETCLRLAQTILATQGELAARQLKP